MYYNRVRMWTFTICKPKVLRSRYISWISKRIHGAVVSEICSTRRWLLDHGEPSRHTRSDKPAWIYRIPCWGRRVQRYVYISWRVCKLSHDGDASSTIVIKILTSYMKRSQVLLTIAITYFSISLLEYVLHSKVMHGNPDTLRRVPIVGNIMAKTAEHHLAHHMEVRMDMKLEPKTDVSGLIFGWETSIILLGLQFGLMMSLKRFTKLSTKSTAIVSLSIMVGYCFLWNSIHLDMHRVSHNVSVAQGVPNMPNALSRGFVYRYLWKYPLTKRGRQG